MKARLLHLLLALVASVPFAQAQDPVFSQFTANPVYANPGLVGLFDGEVRVVVHAREQWASVLQPDPLRTYAASGELRYSVGGRDHLAVSLDALQDQGGRGGFRQTRFGFTTALQKYLNGGRGRDAVIGGVGARIGYGQHAFDPNRLWFSSQFDSISVSVNPGEPALPAGLLPQTLGYLDLTAGVNLSVIKPRYGLVFGLSAHHVNRPNISFVFDANERLEHRYSAMLAAEYLIEDELRLLPAVTYNYQAGGQRLLAGAAIYYKPSLSGDAGVRFGTYARTSQRLEGTAFTSYLEAIILAGQFEFKSSTVGISYDLATGSIGQVVDGRGGFELNYTWRRPGKRRATKVTCPKL